MILKPKKKSPVIAFLLGMLPLLLMGAGLAFGYVFQEQSFKPFGIIPVLLGFLFGWGWGYVYLGHTLRAAAAFVAGSMVGFSVILFLFKAIGRVSMARFDEFEKFAAVFQLVILVIVVVASIGLAIDASRLALRHNREAIQSNSRGQR